MDNEDYTEDERIAHYLGDPEEMGRVFGEGFIAYICYPKNQFDLVPFPDPGYATPLETIRVPYILRRDTEGKYYWARKI